MHVYNKTKSIQHHFGGLESNIAKDHVIIGADNYKLKNGIQNDDVANLKNCNMEPQFCNIINYNDELEFQNHLFGECLDYINPNGQITNIIQHKELEVEHPKPNKKVTIRKLPINTNCKVVKVPINGNVKTHMPNFKPLKETTNNNDMLLLKYSKLANSAYYDMILNGFNRQNNVDAQGNNKIVQQKVNATTVGVEAIKPITPVTPIKIAKIVPKTINQAFVMCPVDKCLTVCRNKVALRKHMYRHTENLFKCPTCDKEFLENSKLKRHQLVHNGARSFDCPYPGCGIRFSLAYNLRKHMEVHYSTAPHKCPMPGCPRIFKRTAYFAEHIKHCKGKIPKVTIRATKAPSPTTDKKPPVKWT